jgi:hypothetical protein
MDKAVARLLFLTWPMRIVKFLAWVQWKFPWLELE